MFRNTYIKVNTDHIKTNVMKVISHYPFYQYYFGVVKADCYGHGLKESAGAVIQGGCNYLAVALLEEALELRNYFPDIPILCFGVIDVKNLKVCSLHNITITIPSFEYAKKLCHVSFPLKVHIKLNTGMNRLGISTEKEFVNTFSLLKKKECIEIEGIYTHFYYASNEETLLKQLNFFKVFLHQIDVSNVKIIHAPASEAITLLPQYDFINGCRLGIIMYGFSADKELKLESTFTLVSQVIQIQELSKGESVGYNGIYKAVTDHEKIAVVAIGYADGIIRKNTGREVFINNRRYKIVGNVCMDMLFVKIDKKVKVGDSVVLLKDSSHIEEVARYLETIPYEILCSITKRVPRVY